MKALLTALLIALCIEGCTSGVEVAESVHTPSGAPANPAVQQFTQEDGYSFRGRMQGDEHFSYIRTDDGYIVLYNAPLKRYEYALIKNGRLEFSGIPVGTQSVPPQIVPIPADAVPHP